jgi:hypothetical protein
VALGGGVEMSGHPLTVTLTGSVTVGDRKTKFKHGHVAGIGAARHERPDAEVASGQPD